MSQKSGSLDLIYYQWNFSFQVHQPPQIWILCHTPLMIFTHSLPLSEVNSGGWALSYMFISLNDPQIQTIAHHPFIEEQNRGASMAMDKREEATMTELRARPKQDSGCRKAVHETLLLLGTGSWGTPLSKGNICINPNKLFLVLARLTRKPFKFVRLRLLLYAVMVSPGKQPMNLTTESIWQHSEHIFCCFHAFEQHLVTFNILLSDEIGDRKGHRKVLLRRYY